MCDTLCVRGRDGTLFAKSSDRLPAEAQVVEWYDARPAGATLRTQYLELPDGGARPLLGSRPTWLWGLEHGVNEAGVAVGNEKVFTVDDPRAQPVGLLGMDLVRLALERAGDSDEALDVLTAALERHGQGGSGEPGRDRPYFSSFLIADARGGWIVETSGRSWAARPTGAGASISNRLALGDDWTRASTDVVAGTAFDARRHPGVPTAIADHRLAATGAAVARGTAVGPRELAAVLRDHGHGPWGAPGAFDRADPPPAAPGDDARGVTVCMHVGGTQATTASMIAALAADAPPRAWACLGNPCVGVYVPVFLAACAPELGRADEWVRFAQLRDRAEHDGDAIGAIREVLAPVEQELWEESDECFVTGLEGERRAFAARAWAPVDAALRKLGV